MKTRNFGILLLGFLPPILTQQSQWTHSKLISELLDPSKSLLKVPPYSAGSGFVSTSFTNAKEFAFDLCNKDFYQYAANKRVSPTSKIRKERAITFSCILKADSKNALQSCIKDSEKQFPTIFPDDLPANDTANADLENELTHICIGGIHDLYKPFATDTKDLKTSNVTVTDSALHEKWDEFFKSSLYETNDPADLNGNWWLHQQILGDYGQRDFRPIWFNMGSNAVNIEFIFQPKTMTDVDMIAGTFEIIGFLDLEWIDPRVAWDSKDMAMYSHINFLELNDNDVWTPPLMVIDGEMDEYNLRALAGEKVIPLTVYMNGKVRMKRFVKIVAFCDTGARVVDYPFDRHNCDIRFGTYDMPMKQLVLSIDKWQAYSEIPPSDISYKPTWDSVRTDSRTIDFSESREWIMGNYNYKKEDAMFLMEHFREGQIHSMVKVSLQLIRTPPFLATTMVAPIILIMLLTNVGLILPCESGEKMGYSITIFLTLVVYMEYISSEIPPWENFASTPRIVRFFMMALSLLTIILFINANAILQNYPKRAKLKSMSYKKIKIYSKIRTINKVLSLLTLDNHLPLALQDTNALLEKTKEDFRQSFNSGSGSKKSRSKTISKSINKIGVAGYEGPLISEDAYHILIDKKTFKSKDTVKTEEVKISEDDDLEENLENLTEIWEFTSQVKERFFFCIIFYVIIAVTIWAFIVPHVNYYFP